MRSGKVILQGLLCFMIVFSLVLPLSGCESPPAAPEPDATPTVQALTSSGLADSPWPKFGQNAQSTGQSPYRGPDRPYLKWSFTTAECVYSSPAIGVDGTIYFGSNDHKLYAISPDGSEKWSFTTQYYVDSSPAIGADGTIYVGSRDRKLYAINPDGSERWSFTTGDLVASSPAIGEDGTIYVGSVDRKLYAINPDGSQRWSFTTGHNVVSSPAIGADGTVYVGSVDRKLYAINPDGSEKWSFTTGADVFSSPAIGVDGTIYIGSFDNRLYAIDPDGSEKWSFTTGDWVYSSPAIGADGTIYVGSRDRKLHAINPDGSEKWSFITGFWVESSPAIGADGTIYVGSDDRKLYAINPDGSQKWSFTTGDLVRSSPAIGADGTVYFGSGRERKLYAITAAYDLTVSSTAWGAVAEPGEGQFTYPGGTAVRLVAEADEGYRFTNWTGDVGTIDDVDDPETTITMSGDYSIVANFELIAGVQTLCVESATGTGEVCITTSHGFIEDLAALPSIPPALPADIRLPHGMFSFKVTGIDLGQTVTITVELPGPAPSGTRWWKEHMGAWYSIPVTVVEPNVISFTLTDGIFPGDSDKTEDGVITDPGGPGNPAHKVGWEGSSANKAAVMAPWIALLAVMASATLLILQHRRAQI